MVFNRSGPSIISSSNFFSYVVILSLLYIVYLRLFWASFVTAHSSFATTSSSLVRWNIVPIISVFHNIVHQSFHSPLSLDGYFIPLVDNSMISKNVLSTHAFLTSKTLSETVFYQHYYYIMYKKVSAIANRETGEYKRNTNLQIID